MRFPSSIKWESKLKLIKMKNETIEFVNTGEASLKIELKNNIIYVYHGTDGALLIKRRATSESWDSIMRILRSNI